MKRNAIVRRRLFVLLWMSLVGTAGVTAAADESRGITVSGTGVVEAMPDTVELTATVAGTAELAGDAVEKYRGNKRRIVEALGALNLEGVTIVGSGLSVNSGAQGNAMPVVQAAQANQPQVGAKVGVQEQLTITLSGVDTMSADNLLQAVTRVVDVAKDAGVTIGPGPKSMIEVQFSGGKPGSLATFKLSQTDTLRQQAYEAALKQARAKAERLAELAGLELGDIVSIRETVPSAKDDNGGGFAAYIAMFSGMSSSHPEYTSTELKNIPVAVSLTVQFDVVKKK